MEVENWKQMQQQLPKSKWGDLSVDNTWHFKYLDSIIQADGRQLKDILTRIVRARTRFGKMWHLWNEKTIHYNLRLRLYKSSVCNIIVYGSEAWKLNSEAVKKINGARWWVSYQVKHLTRRCHQNDTTLILLDGCVCDDSCDYLWLESDRKIKQTVFEMLKSR